MRKLLWVGSYFRNQAHPSQRLSCVPCVPLSLFWCIFYVEKWNFLHKQREKGKIKVYFTWNDFPSFFLSFFERYVSSLTNWATWEDLQNYRNFSDKIYVHCNLFPRVDELCFTILVTFFTSFQLEAIRKALRHFFYVMFYLFYFILDVSDATKLNINSKACFLRHTASPQHKLFLEALEQKMPAMFALGPKSICTGCAKKFRSFTKYKTQTFDAPCFRRKNIKI